MCAIWGPPCSHFGFCRWFYVFHGRSARIKKLILQKFILAPNNLGLNTFGHFWAPWQPFWILQEVLYFSKKECSDQKTILQKLSGAPSFWVHFGFCRQFLIEEVFRSKEPTNQSCSVNNHVSEASHQC